VNKSAKVYNLLFHQKRITQTLMKKINLLLAFIFLSSFNLKAQTEWLIREGAGHGIITTNISDNIITGQTRKNALKDYAGGFKFSMARALTPLKYPEIIHFKGTFTDVAKNKFTGIYNRLTSEKKMEGEISGDSIFIKLLSKNKMELIKGVKRSLTSVAKDYSPIVKKIIDLTEEKLYEPKFLQSKKWENFKNKMTANSKKIKDDLELQIGFFAIKRYFPFSHYALARHNNKTEASTNFSIKEITSKTCVLDINAFEGNRGQVDSLINIIDMKRYDNLIIDLRNNPGGDVESATPLMEFISSKETIIGVFPNSKWYKENQRFPTVGEYGKFNEFNAGSLNEFYKQAEAGYGVFLKCIPSKKHFNGKVFVVTNRNTGSTSEVVALALKENKLATLVGQKTAGAVLSAKVFNINEGFDFIIPQNDYISYGGYRIDKIGVVPDITIDKQDEVDYILNTLIPKKP
jgi:Peptidase family S41